MHTRLAKAVTATLLMGAMVVTSNPVGADPLTFANCNRHRVCRNDNTRPRVRISSPASGAHVGRTFWVRGTARDNVKIARVIVRLDSGRWRRAEGTTRWRASMARLRYGWHTIRVRAVDFARNTHTRNIRVYVARPATNYTAPPATNFEDPAPPTAPTGNTYGPPAVASDCSADVSAALNSWMASIPDNSTILFDPDGCYRVETTLLLTERNTLLIDGQGAVFRRTQLSPPELQWPEGNRHWEFDGGNHITIQNVRVEGTNTESDVRAGFASYEPMMEFEHGMAFHGVTSLVVDNVDTTSTWGDGLYFGPYRGIPTNSAFVRNVDIRNNGRQAVALSGAENILFDNVTIHNSRRAGFDLEPPPGFVRSIEIRNSFINSHLIAFASGGRGDVSNIFIHHNTIDASGVPVVYVRDTLGRRRFNWRVENNVSLRPRGSPLASIAFWNVTNATVRDNDWPIHTGQSRKAVEFRAATGTLLVLSNDFTGACRSYHRDSLTTTVVALGNTTSNC